MTRNAKLLVCIEACKEAIEETHRCAAVCVKYGWRRKGRMLALLCFDAADACEATLKALSRGSQKSAGFCALSAALAQQCAEECLRYADACHCQASAQACRTCAEACRKCAEVCRTQAGTVHFLNISATCYLESRE